MKRLLPLALLVAVLQSAPAAIVWSGMQNLTIPVSASGGSIGDEIHVSIAPVGFASNADFTSYDVAFSFGGFLLRSSAAFLPVRLGTDVMDPLANLSFGTLVGGFSTFSAPAIGVSDSHVGPGAGQFGNGLPGYLGFQFDDAGETKFGWMQVILTNNQDNGGSLNPTVVQWAYEDQAGTAISAGAVPEPGALALALLGGTGFLFRRRRA